jgi:hypothetical protein
MKNSNRWDVPASADPATMAEANFAGWVFLRGA